MNSYWIPIERDIAILLAMKMGDPFSLGQIRDTIRLIVTICSVTSSLPKIHALTQPLPPKLCAITNFNQVIEVTLSALLLF